MKSKIKSIPTRYRGRIYRSRLEVRWAAMFDFLEWQVEYEPFILNGWIPDFVILGKNEILVEIKPYLTWDEFLPEIQKVLKATEGTIKENKDILFLGAMPTFKGFSKIGWIGTFLDVEGLKNEYEYGEAIITRHNGKFGILNLQGNGSDRIIGLSLPEHEGALINLIPDYIKVKRLWAEAGNLTQWKAPKLVANF